MREPNETRLDTLTPELATTEGLRAPAGELDADAALMVRLAAGDESAFETLLARRRQWVLSLVYRFVGDREEAEDLAQEAFVRLYRSRRRYKPSAAFSTFLYRLVVNPSPEEGGTHDETDRTVRGTGDGLRCGLLRGDPGALKATGASR